MAKNIGVLLAGCGVFDGTEIHEAVLTLLFVDRAGAQIVCLAPDKPQHHVIDHLSQQETASQRNVLVESARIARGEIRSLKTVAASDLDALIIPGGFGAAKNLSDFAFKGPGAEVDADVVRLIRDMASARKPIGAICIAPAVLAKALADRHPVVTIGNDVGTARAIEAMGGVHQDRAVDEICVDEANRLVTTPAYMLGPGVKEVARGIEKLVAKVMEMLDA
ncbi:MAG TPA: isoprenoid biosynthesis glyoxalase ElbB [Desulfobacteraceae bacterium]|nr:isoprenoid biosynthesis glyoxalase ElbB [Deltaproteobacteria bacterium]MBW2356811.1 isoprenoid biosynthesis glyoxalase ElbB [Deltaproteobacteria bacterium]HDI59855.1 isoprenoid biosynthesis glyoxalase ElbB [Desulfobacteraceae bacterium]